MKAVILTMNEKEVADVPFDFYIPSRCMPSFSRAVAIWKGKKRFPVDVEDILFFMPDEDIMAMHSYSQTLGEFKESILKNLSTDVHVVGKVGIVREKKVKYFCRVSFGDCVGRVIKTFLLWAKVGYYNKITTEINDKWIRKSKLKVL